MFRRKREAWALPAARACRSLDADLRDGLFSRTRLSVTNRTRRLGSYCDSRIEHGANTACGEERPSPTLEANAHDHTRQHAVHHDPRRYLRREHETLQVKVDGAVKLTVPMHHLEGVVCFGRVSLSSGVYAACEEHDLTVSFLTEQGRFLARIVGPTQGNVLLRRQQYRLADDPAACLKLARPMIAGKIQNARQVLLRSARERDDEARTAALRHAADHIAAVVQQLPSVTDLDVARGIEGETARTYFESFNHLILHDAEAFRFDGRSRRPPLSPVNALLSFVYALVRHDCESALEAVGLLPHIQARLLARTIRGDLQEYPALVLK